MRNVLFGLFVFCIGLTGCSLDYRDAQESEELLESVPDVVFKQFEHIAVNGQTMVFRLEAEEARLFNKKKITELFSVRFVEYDDSGAKAIEGRAERATFHTDTENAELSGNIYGYSAADEVAFYAQNLTWLRDERLLKSVGNQSVRIKKDDGSYIEGIYFTIDARRKRLTFDAAVRGRYFHETETEND